MGKRAIALTNPLVVDQLCEAIISKLRSSDCLLNSGPSPLIFLKFLVLNHKLSVSAGL